MAWVTVFLAGIAMAPVFPTTLSVVNDHVPQDRGHRHRHCRDGRMVGPGGQFADYRRDRRRRPQAAEEGAAGAARVFAY